MNDRKSNSQFRTSRPMGGQGSDGRLCPEIRSDVFSDLSAADGPGSGPVREVPDVLIFPLPQGRIPSGFFSAPASRGQGCTVITPVFWLRVGQYSKLLLAGKCAGKGGWRNDGHGAQCGKETENTASGFGGCGADADAGGMFGTAERDGTGAVGHPGGLGGAACPNGRNRPRRCSAGDGSGRRRFRRRVRPRTAGRERVGTPRNRVSVAGTGRGVPGRRRVPGGVAAACKSFRIAGTFGAAAGFRGAGSFRAAQAAPGRRVRRHDVHEARRPGSRG